MAESGPCGIGLCVDEASQVDVVRFAKQLRRRSVNFCSEEGYDCVVAAEGCCRGAGSHETIGCAEGEEFESLMQELFRVHDLNENGLLEELELIQLNKKIAMLHYGKDVDLAAITAKYRELYRTGLDPEGQPVPYPAFRKYMTKVLFDLDPDVGAQEMVMQQFINEAVLARSAFHFPSTASVSDLPFLSKIRADNLDVLEALRWDRGVPASEEMMNLTPRSEGEAERGELYVFRIPPGVGIERVVSTTSGATSKA